MGRFSKDKRDIYYRKAKESGYRARSAYKLLHIDEQHGIFKDVTKAVDLCAAPGSWSQVLSNKLYKENQDSENQVKLVAVDLQEIAPINGVTLIQGDITSNSTSNRIIELFDGQKADLVVCDGAPDVTGLHDMDVYIQSQLLLSALSITLRILRSGGVFVAKIFRGRDVGLLYAQLNVFFKEVMCCKPKSSRNSSLEAFVVCKGFSLPSSEDFDVSRFVEYLGGNCDESNALITNFEKQNVPFVHCGDLSGYDSDKSYALDCDEDVQYVYHEPVQAPINPPYKEFQAKRSKVMMQ